eukprot:293533-Chlamydomonas_euryale.AAC.8
MAKRRTDCMDSTASHDRARTSVWQDQVQPHGRPHILFHLRPGALHMLYRQLSPATLLTAW